MGVDRKDYLMWAVNIDPDLYDVDTHENITEFDVVYDGMCGKYCMVGTIIAESDEYAGFEKIVDIGQNIFVDKEKIVNNVNKYFPPAKITIDDFSLKLFSHFS